MKQDEGIISVKIHRDAQESLFSYYKPLRSIFSDVIGLMEVDYLGIALINERGELKYFSSHPSVEYNLIEHNLWKFDMSYPEDVFYQNKIHWWYDKFSLSKHAKLNYFRLESPRFRTGFSVPSLLGNYRVVYSFAFKSPAPDLIAQVEDKIDTLISMGRYCVNNVLNVIASTQPSTSVLVSKPKLTLIINNELS